MHIWKENLTIPIRFASNFIDTIASYYSVNEISRSTQKFGKLAWTLLTSMVIKYFNYYNILKQKNAQ